MCESEMCVDACSCGWSGASATQKTTCMWSEARAHLVVFLSRGVLSWLLRLRSCPLCRHRVLAVTRRESDVYDTPHTYVHNRVYSLPLSPAFRTALHGPGGLSADLGRSFERWWASS